MRRRALLWMVPVALGVLAALAARSERHRFARIEAESVGAERDEGREGDAGDEQEDASGAAEWFYRQRAWPAARIADGAYAHARGQWSLQRAAAVRPAGRRDHGAQGGWTFVGPDAIDTTDAPPNWGSPNMSPSSGRADTVAVNPEDPSVLYAGAALGGVWKSIDAGATWTPIFDDMDSLAIAAIVLDPGDPDVVWVATGNPALYNGFTGSGLYRSTDAGGTWTKVGGDGFDGLTISRLILDGHDVWVATHFGIEDLDYVCDYDTRAAGQGVYVSHDDGASFSRVYSGVAVDLELDTTRTPRRVFVSDFQRGLQRSEDGGDTWHAPSGIHVDPYSDIDVAIAPSDPDVVYAAVGAYYSGGVLYASDDGGESFSTIDAPDWCETQCYYDNVVGVDPDDPARVWLGGSLCAVFETDDATASDPTWTNVSSPYDDCGRDDANWGRGRVHPDVHGLSFGPDATLYVGSDGGLARTSDLGATWERPDLGLGTLQFYGICVDPTDGDVVYGGMQDNGIAARRGSDTWTQISSGDGGRCAIDAGDPSRVLTEIEYGYVFRSDDGYESTPEYVFDGYDSGRVAFIPPLVSDPGTPGTFYTGTQKLYRTSDGGDDWDAVSDDLTAGAGRAACAGSGGGSGYDDALSAIAVAPSDPDTIYTGSEFGRVEVTRDGGDGWTRIDYGLPDRWVTDIAVDPNDPANVWVVFSGFGSATPDEPGHVYRSSDAGASWTLEDIGADIPVNAIVTHPVSSDVAYVGTDLGVLVTIDGGATWETLGDDSLPNTVVSSLAFSPSDDSLVAATFGRSVWRYPFDGGLVADPDTLDVELGAGDRGADARIVLANTDPYGGIARFSATSDQGWLTLGVTGGAAAGPTGTTVPVHVDVPTRHAGTFDGDVTITAASGDVITVPVHVTVRGATGGCGASSDGCGCAQTGGGAGFYGFAAGILLLVRRRGRRDA